MGLVTIALDYCKSISLPSQYKSDVDMLVLTTMFVGLSQTLPKTSYIKMVDIWLIFNLLIPFVEVLIHILEVKRNEYSYNILFIEGFSEEREGRLRIVQDYHDSHSRR